MKKSIVEQWTDGDPDGVVFEGSREECERFVELERELNGLRFMNCPLTVNFEIDGELVQIK